MVCHTETKLERATGEPEDLLVRAPHTLICETPRSLILAMSGDHQNSARWNANAELEHDPEVCEAEAMLAAANGA